MVPFAGVGSGNTLSGRTRATLSTPVPAPAPTTTNGSAASRANAPAVVDDSPMVPFAGAGQSMSGRRPIETIEID